MGTELLDTCAGLPFDSAKYVNNGVSTCTESNLTTQQEITYRSPKAKSPTNRAGDRF